MASDAQRVADALVAFVERGIRLVTLEVHSLLVERTPKDTTWAASNWLINAGSPASGPVGKRGYGPGDVVWGPQEAGRLGVAAYRMRQGDVWISNRVPYITKLNQGSSAQAPSGYVQVAMIDGVVEGLRKLGDVR